MNVFEGFKNWVLSFRKKKVEEKIPDIGISKDDPDYEAHMYLFKHHGYSKKIRRAIIHNFKKQGGKLEY